MFMLSFSLILNFIFKCELMFPGTLSLRVLCVLSWEYILPEMIYIDSWKLGHASNMDPFSFKFSLGYFHPWRLGTQPPWRPVCGQDFLEKTLSFLYQRPSNEKGMFFVLGFVFFLHLLCLYALDIFLISVSLRVYSVWFLALCNQCSLFQLPTLPWSKPWSPVPRECSS